MNPASRIFSIYRSSAGSGKTRTLAKEYLKLALKFKADYFRYILAVTFTNKASQEMKDRILAYLDAFSKGSPNELAAELKAELRMDDLTFQYHSQAVQAAVLHQYSQFSISTIDAFFQRVIRSFTRESGLIGDYRLEVEHDTVLEEVIDNLIDELGSNRELTDWVVEFAKENLENERAWDVRYSLIEFAREIFREEFKAIEDEVGALTATPGFFRQMQEQLRDTKNQFLNAAGTPAREALAIIRAHGWTPDDFSYGRNSGLLTFFQQYAFEKTVNRIKPPSDRIRTYFTQAANWPGKKSRHASEIHRIASTQLTPLLIEILEVHDRQYTAALSAEVVLKNLYVFGLVADIARKLKEYKDENNLMLLADAPKFLNGVIQDSDTPFIYEKVGSFYRNYLIDEFQDTSGLQWKNFQPLIINSLDQGHSGLVVGDVKQAIYRWRGGDLNLLQRGLAAHVGESRIDLRELDRNFRSAKAVVDFNNQFFTSASHVLAALTETDMPVEAYRDVAQKISREETGFVDIRFIREPVPEEEQRSLTFEERPEEKTTASRWNEIALEQLPHTLEELQQRGASLRDVAILVRKNEEGQRIATYLLQYKNSGLAQPGCRYDVVSNESLRIDGAASVNLLLGAMRYLLNADDAIARAQLGYEFSRLRETARETSDVFAVTNQAIFENNLPPAFAGQKAMLKKLSLIELTEALIGIFALGQQQGELVYLQAFQDLVLTFYNRERNDLGSFLEWWETNRQKKSVQISGDVDAAQILTIHKSKGLQFKYIIVPFCSWNLDHEAWQSPNLWCRTDQPPFTGVGFVPVRYSKTLEQTFFASYYKEEFSRSYLDNLNLLYVAFTRAELGLIVTAPHPEVKGVKTSVASLLFQSIQSDEVLKRNWNEADARWSSGEMTTVSSTVEPPAGALQLNEYLSSEWRDKLVIRHSGATYFTDPEEAREKKNYRLHMHAVLSRMRYSDEIDGALQALLFDGLITAADLPSLEKQLRELMNTPQVATWFSRDWTVLTEVPILVPNASESRLDRLIYRDKKAIVIDFKTGAKKKTDGDQVIGYLSLLRQMNFTDVEGFLLYLKDSEIVEVKTGAKPKAIRQKDKDQLSLGF